MVQERTSPLAAVRQALDAPVVAVRYLRLDLRRLTIVDVKADSRGEAGSDPNVPGSYHSVPTTVTTETTEADHFVITFVIAVAATRCEPLRALPRPPPVPICFCQAQRPGDQIFAPFRGVEQRAQLRSAPGRIFNDDLRSRPYSRRDSYAICSLKTPMAAP